MSTITFNNFYKKRLQKKAINEGIISDFASGFQKGMNDAKEGKLPANPFKKDNIKNIKENKIGFKNPPKKGEILVLFVKQNLQIKAKVNTKINKNGQWEIELINDKNAQDPFCYYISNLHPNGVITTPSFMRKTHKTQQQINSIEGPYIGCIVGLGTPYPTWYKEKDVLRAY